MCKLIATGVGIFLGIFLLIFIVHILAQLVVFVLCIPIWVYIIGALLYFSLIQ